MRRLQSNMQKWDVISGQAFRLVYLNLSFYSLFLVVSVLGIPLLVMFVALTSLFSPRRNVMRRFRRAISFYGSMVIRLPSPLIKVKYEDLSGSKPSGPYIVVCNHRASSDAFLMSVLPFEAVQVVNTWPFKIPVLGFFAKLAGYLNINALSREEFFTRSNKLLKEKVSIIFFPEGTRSGDRKMGHFHSAAFRLFLESKVPIIPLCLSGNEEVPRKGSLLLRKSIVRVRTLPPIRWEDHKDLSSFAIKNMVRDKIEQELVTMEGAA